MSKDRCEIHSHTNFSNISKIFGQTLANKVCIFSYIITDTGGFIYESNRYDRCKN